MAYNNQLGIFSILTIIIIRCTLVENRELNLIGETKGKDKEISTGREVLDIALFFFESVNIRIFYRIYSN